MTTDRKTNNDNLGVFRITLRALANSNPRVALWQPWETLSDSFTQGFKPNPALELANAFSVNQNPYR
jgi:hypothetical protein